jgi:hypothetical protein
LQREQGVACFFRFHRGHQFVSSALMDPISKTFIAALEAFARQEKVPVIQFRKGQRKDDVAAEQRKKFQKTEGVVFIGKAQEKTPVFRTERKRMWRQDRQGYMQMVAEGVPLLRRLAGSSSGKTRNGIYAASDVPIGTGSRDLEEYA